MPTAGGRRRKNLPVTDLTAGGAAAGKAAGRLYLWVGALEIIKSEGLCSQNTADSEQFTLAEAVIPVGLSFFQSTAAHFATPGFLGK